jgi:antitoxin component of RelBE/YafQ-DinJ toxin-antitoxin module
MNTAAIYIKTQPEVKAKAQKIAKNLGFSLSSLVDSWLKQFVKTKRVTYRAKEDERPSKYLTESLKRSEEDIKEGRVLSFDSGEDAVKYFKSLEGNE